MAAEHTEQGSVVQDFEEAIGRLVVGKPRHPELIARAAKSRLRININVVALEAGHSRTLLYAGGDRYQQLRSRILELSATVQRAGRENATARAARLNEENAELTRQVALVISENATLIARLASLEHQMRTATERIELLKRGTAKANLVLRSPETYSTDAD